MRLKWICFLCLCCSGFTSKLFSQRVQILSGTQLVYEVEEWGRKYRYTVTVKAFSDSTQLLEWKASGKTVYKGKSINQVIDADNADRLLIKPNMESEEWLDEYTERLRPPGLMQDEIEAGADTLEYGLDLADALLVRRTGGGSIKDVIYNGAKTNFEFRRYNDPFLQVTIGFMPFGARGWWPYSYKDENTSLRLVEVITILPPPALPKPAIDSLSAAEIIPQ